MPTVIKRVTLLFHDGAVLMLPDVVSMECLERTGGLPIVSVRRQRGRRFKRQSHYGVKEIISRCATHCCSCIECYKKRT